MWFHIKTSMLRLGLVLWLGFFAQCSLIVDTSIDNLLCKAGACNEDEGYSCLQPLPTYTSGVIDPKGQCIKNGTRKQGDYCSKTAQCAEGLICPERVGVCSQPCQAPLLPLPAATDPDAETICPKDMVCAPAYDVENPGKFIGGACVPMECSADPNDSKQPCKNGDYLYFVNKSTDNRCVVLRKGAGGVCMTGCQIGARSTSGGLDTCTVDVLKNKQHCGVASTGDFVCLPIGNAPVGQVCSVFPQAGVNASADACGLSIDGFESSLALMCLYEPGVNIANTTTKPICRQQCNLDAQCGANMKCCGSMTDVSSSGVAKNARFCTKVEQCRAQ